ncbi:hypothetical protein CRV08_08325 [Halarcobacter ebronensis]|uniref:Uncharacterized protein n=1 Tax=Halarcobacter ebronensis TaxID=1462615 RepID=A0A4Q0YGS7_9BACT|nr:hypothetical protein [Halarcobacter ebronensis]RXJ68249.1 hypothetical protein CRV08_08325 [Halarcobacter ebronensis]
MEEIQIPIKKTKIINQFKLLEDDYISDLSFLDKNTVIFKVYNEKEHETRFDIFSLENNSVINTLKVDYETFKSLCWCKFRDGVAILTDVGLTFLSLKEKSASPVFYKLRNAGYLKYLTGDKHLRTPKYLNIKEIDEKYLLIRVSTFASNSGRAMSILEVEKETCAVMSIYKELDEPEIVDMLGVGFGIYNYIHLREATFSYDRIWCLAEGNSLDDLLKNEPDYMLCTSYRYDELGDKRSIFKILLDNFKNKGAYNPFKWNETKLKIKGGYVFFSDDSKYIWSRIRGKNRMFCQDIRTGEFLHEIRITPAQSLKEISFRKAVVRMYDSIRFIVYNCKHNESNCWNLCEVINL